MLKRTPPGTGKRRVRRTRGSQATTSYRVEAARADGPDLSELSNVIGYALRRAQLAAFKNFKETYKGFNITPAQYSVLMVIDRNPGLKQNQISDALGIKRANFVLLLNTLESRGLAQRAPASDRRSYALQLTPRGKAFLKKLRALSGQLETEFSAPIGPEGRATLLKLLNALTDEDHASAKA